MKPLELYLVRHGEPKGGGVFLGRGSDPPLSNAGRVQAEALARRLLPAAFDIVYTSPLRRASETAEIILADRRRPKLTPEVLGGLREIGFGAWEGRSYDEIGREQRDILDAWTADPRSVTPPGGEAFVDFEARVLGCFDEIITAHPGGVVLVVGHGGPFRVYLSRVLELSTARMWSFSLPRGSLSLVKIYPPRMEIIEFLNCSLDHP